MITLYYNPICIKSKMIRIMLEEIKLDYDVKVENFWELRENFVRLSPSAELPVFIEKDNRSTIVIPGWYPVLEYLIESYENDSFIATDNLVNSEIRRMISWVFGKFYEDSIKIIIEERLLYFHLKKSSPDSKSIQLAKSRLKEHLEYFSSILGNRDWIACNKSSMADMALAAAISILDYMGEINWHEYKQLKSWYMIMKSKPSFRFVLKEKILGYTASSTYELLDF